MALSVNKLAQGLLELALERSFPRDPVEAGKRFSHAYALYAADALSTAAAPPNSLAAGEAVLATELAKVWISSRTAPSTAQGIAAALTAFWLTPPVTFGTGVVSAVTGTTALSQALPGVWAGNQSGRQSPEACVKRVAAAMDAFTHTVITTTPPGPVIGPIT